MNRGKNAGIAGTLVSVLLDGRPGAGGGAALAFNAKITEHSGGLSWPKIDRRGRGLAGVPKIRLGDVDGAGTIEGEYQVTGYPSPDKPQFAAGTLISVMRRDAGGNALDFVAFPVRFTGQSWSLGEQTADLWTFKAQWELAGLPAWTWNGVQVTFSAPDANDQETYEGLAKTYDGNGLNTGAVQRIDCEGISDTDAAEATKLAALLAAATAPPLPNLKVVSLALSRTDSNGIAVFITWGLQDSKDQIETPQNVFVTDPNAIQDLRTLAQVFVTGSPPSDPTPPTGLKLATYSDLKLNDQNSARTWTMKRTDTADDILNPEITITTDPNAIGSAATVGVLFDPDSPPSDPTPPSGLKLRPKRDVKINDLVWNRRYEYTPRDTLDDVQMPETNSFRSAQAAFQDTVAAVYASSDTDADSADSLFGSFQSVANAFGLRVRSIDPANKVAVYQYVNPGILVQGLGYGGGRSVDARIDSSNVQLFVLDNLARGTGYRRIRLSRRWIIDKPLRQFVITRLFRGTTIPDTGTVTVNGVSLTFPGFGQVNTSTFLGLDAKTVIYELATYTTNIALSGTLPFFMGYHFTEDANGFFTGVPDDFFTAPLTLATSTTTQQDWVNASDLGLDSVVTAPGDADFSAFLGG